jgi:stage V sporulation protein T
MKTTGIVRRVDDLGRIVIPKEIRRALKIKEGDPLEIYVDDNMVCFRNYKYQAVEDACQEVLNASADLVNAEQRDAIVAHLKAIRELIFE